MKEKRAKKRPLDLDWEELLPSRDDEPQPVLSVEATTKSTGTDTEPPKKSVVMGSDHRHSQRDEVFESIRYKRQRKLRRLNKMAGRKWEELNMDCLVNVLGRVGMESLLLDIPFVCKSWYRASLNPSCWEHLIFPKIQPTFRFGGSFMHRLMKKYRIGAFSFTSAIKFIIKRSHGNATIAMLPSGCTEETLKYVADECPALKTLALPFDLCNDYSVIIPELIGKWKNLEVLKLGCVRNLEKVLAGISLHCKNFCGLAAFVANVGRDEASAIVNLLPNIKRLVLRGAVIDRENLLIILKGCKELVFLDVRDCVGFAEGDDQILKLASHICKFKYEGSRLFDDDHEVDEEGIDEEYWIYRNKLAYDGYYSDECYFES